MRNTFRFIVSITALVLTAATALAFTDEFYKGKTLRIIVGTAAGGGFDTYSRVIARHIGKHLPGNPGVIVQNMPGRRTSHCCKPSLQGSEAGWPHHGQFHRRPAPASSFGTTRDRVRRSQI